MCLGFDTHEAVKSLDFMCGYYRVPVLKALDPMKPRDYLIIVARLSTEIASAAAGEEAAAMRMAIDHLDVDWDKATPEARDRVVQAASTVIATAAPRIIAPIESVLTVTGSRIVGDVKVATKDTYKLNATPELTKTDEGILKSMVKNQALYVRDEMGRRSDTFSKTARSIVESGVSQGMGRDAIADKLNEKLTAQGLAKSQSYWRMLAGVFAGRSRTYGGLSSMADNGIETYTIEAVMDEVTSCICRLMDGKEFEVQRALDKYAEVEASGDPESVRFTMSWVNMGKDDDGNEVLYIKEADGSRTTVAGVEENAVGQVDAKGKFREPLTDEELEEKGILVPPFHGECRSRIVPLL